MSPSFFPKGFCTKHISISVHSAANYYSICTCIIKTQWVNWSAAKQEVACPSICKWQWPRYRADGNFEYSRVFQRIARRAHMALRNATVLPRAKGEGGLCMNRRNPSLRQDLLQAISQLAGHIRYSKKRWITGFMTAKWPYRTLLTGYCALATFRF
jgi:hypothetical protein